MAVGKTTAIVLLALLAACTYRFGPSQIPVAKGAEFDLLPPASFGQSLSITQLARMDYADDVQEMLFVSEITPQAISIVGLLPNGTRLFSIVYDGVTIESDGYEQLLNRIQPAFFLADFQFSQWPLADIVAQFRQSSSCFEERACVFSESQDRLQRSFSVRDDRVMTINYGGLPVLDNTIDVTHHRRGYHISLTTLAVDAL